MSFLLGLAVLTKVYQKIQMSFKAENTTIEYVLGFPYTFFFALSLSLTDDITVPKNHSIFLNYELRNLTYFLTVFNFLS